ncbi:MAG: hypothetical protein GX616_08810 [Planctomycetes bacterium]|nr:hypothetical protein [Planctomycetota bacterium]
MPAEKMNWLKQLPPIEMEPWADPRWEEVARYGEILFDPRQDGFSNELEYLADLPFRKSVDVKASPLGVGFEVLDHRCAYDFDKVMPFMRDSGVKWARIQSGWQRAETEIGRYDFGWLDHIVDGLKQAWIEPWVSLSFGNGLYMDAEPIQLQRHSTYFYSPTAFGEKGIRGWENYCRAMARHFNSRIAYWEVWNEPNAGYLRKPGLGAQIVPEPPSEYARLVAHTARAVRSVQPRAKIIGGSISGGGLCNAYIKGLFDSGLAEHIDIFSYHPYGAIPELHWPERLQYIRDQIARSGRPIGVWQGENGRPSEWNITGKGWKYTEANQARFLTRRYLTDLRLGIAMRSYYQACDLGNGYNPGPGVYSQGVINANDPDHYKPKLAFRAMQSFAWLFDSETRPIHVNFEVHPYGVTWAKTTRPVDGLTALSCGFERGGIPIYAYYHPSHIDSDYEVRPVQIILYNGGDFRLDRPVLIDPIAAKIYKIKSAMRLYENTPVFKRMPLLDYPLFVTDASIL